MKWITEHIKVLCNKRTLYFLCVLALNYIEFLRSTGTGDVWKAATNCIGLVMMVIIFSNYPIKNFLNKLNYIYTAFCIIAMIVIRFHWGRHVGEYYLWQVEIAVLNIWWIGIMLRYLFEQVVITKQMKIRIGVLGWLWIAMVAWSVIGGSKMVWPLWFLFIFGFFYITKFSKEDWNALVNALVNGTICSFFAIQSYAYLFRPYDEVRYKGAFVNCNSMALYYMIVYVMILSKLHQLHMKKAKIGWKLFYFLGAGGLLAFQFLTVCRTAWIASIVITIAYGFVVLRNKWKDSFIKIFLRGCALALCATITFFPVFYSVRYLPAIHPHPIWHTGDPYSEYKVHSWDPIDSETYVEMHEFLEVALGRINHMLKDFHISNLFVIRANAKEAVTYVEDSHLDFRYDSFKLRLEMWKTYLKESTLFGHSIEAENFALRSSNARVWHAQNVWVQFTYTYGIPVGVLFVVMTILLLFETYRYGKRNDEFYGIIPFIVCVSFFVFGLTELVWNSGQYILTIFFFVLHPQFWKVIEGEKV